MIKNMGVITRDEKLPANAVNRELDGSGKFVVFQYCISIVIMTFKRPSKIYFVRTGESTIKFSIRYSLISLFFGWWGIPWGPIYTISSLFGNFTGGTDVTKEFVAAMQEHNPEHELPKDQVKL